MSEFVSQQETGPQPRRVDFVKAHCGWDTVTLVPGGEYMPAVELETALWVLDEPVCGGLEVGFIEASAIPNEFVLRMVSSTARDWIPMCGGMTQVIGKVLVETRFRQRFAVDTGANLLSFVLLTPAGRISIKVDQHNGRVSRVITEMRDYLQYLYRIGVSHEIIHGVPVIQAGDYAVVEVEALKRVHPDLEFTHRRPGPALDTVNAILAEFGARRGVDNVNGMLFDARPAAQGAFRVYPRFFSPDLAAARLPREFQCGTGSVAVAVALKHSGRLAGPDAQELILEWGNLAETPDPYGIRTSTLWLEGISDVLDDISFTHSVVEILEEGQLVLPAFVGR